MDIKTEKKNNITIVYLNGRLDINESAVLESSINALIESGEKKLIFDLKDLSYLSSSGLRVFISTFKKLKEKEGVMKIVGIQPTVYKILKMVEFDNIFDIKDTVDEALKTI
ncbi:MAG TPA: STAS domain-containing protein [Spirochaetota bacterium]|nr:STAS domain-containing protein [Spirochaetota bacterium]HOM39257.1 STAS domain-containing protein [Spirochaetota bacterium]HPQ49258.1 STAS domain-containing protein [Spirochaetota bacterium]